MLHNILYNRGIRVGLVLCLLIVGGSLLYYEYVKRSSRSNLEQTQQKLKGIKGPQSKSISTGSTPLKEQANAIQNEDGIENASSTALRGAVQDNTENHSEATIDNASEETIISEIQEEIIAEAEEAPEPLSAEELRRQELLQQRAALNEEIKALVPDGHTVHSSDDPETLLQVLELTKALTQIEGELNGYIDRETVRSIDLAINLTSNLDIEGNLPITAAAKIADSFEEEGKFEAANRMRSVIQNALKNGDEVLKEKHLTGIQ